MAASISGLASLADTVVTRGFRYMKAVKDCDKDVERLISETNALGSLLSRLQQEAEEHEHQGKDDHNEDGRSPRNLGYTIKLRPCCAKVLEHSNTYTAAKRHSNRSERYSKISIK